MAQVDLADARDPLEDLVALHTAEDADELHRRLLCFPDWGGNKADAFEPWCLMRKFHAQEPEGAEATAVLLLTEAPAPRELRRAPQHHRPAFDYAHNARLATAG